MQKKIVEYGTTHNVRVESATKTEIIVISDELKEGFVLLGHGMEILPSKGDTGIITFVKGGVMNGYWEFTPNKL